MALANNTKQDSAKSLRTVTRWLKGNAAGILTAAFLLFSASAILSLPVEPLNLLTPPSEAYFRLVSDVAEIVVHVTGKGGISAGNPLNIDVTVTIDESAMSFTVSAVEVVLENAKLFPINKSAIGTPSFELHQDERDKWHRDMRVIYYQGGIFGASLTLRGMSKTTPNLEIVLVGSLCELPPCNFIAISSEEVTVLAKTNALLMSLSLAFLAFSCLELRLEYSRNHTEPRQPQYAALNNEGT